MTPQQERAAQWPWGRSDRLAVLAGGTVLLLLLLDATVARANGWDDGTQSCLDNGVATICVSDDSGGGISSFVLDSNRTFNYLNGHDSGRFIQQSYYGSEWQDAGHTIPYPEWGPDHVPWRYNPIQGGHRVQNGYNDTANLIYVRTTPTDWVLGTPDPDSIMEEWIELVPQKAMARIHFRFQYVGSRTDHPVLPQEAPAVFVNRAFGVVAYGTSSGITTVIPPCLVACAACATECKTKGDPNMDDTPDNILTPGWVAAVNGGNTDGVGVYVNNAPIRAGYYKHIVNDNPADTDNTTYIGPQAEFAITPGLVYTYDAYVRIGTSLTTMAAEFGQIRLGAQYEPFRRYVSAGSGDHWCTGDPVISPYSPEFRLGSTMLLPGPGKHALYGCRSGNDHFISLQSDCEGATPAGIEHFAYDSAGANRVQIFRCFTGWDHFVSLASNCEGTTPEGSLGYLPQTQVSIFWGGDTDRRGTELGDWNWGKWKATCDSNECMVGLSHDTQYTFNHGALCYPTGVSGTQVAVLSGSYDNRRTQRNQDWDYGYYKWECGTNEYVSGVSQSVGLTIGTLDAIRCSSGGGSTSNCERRVIDSGSGYSGAYGDWDYGFYKADCPTGKVAVGISRGPDSHTAHALLCCTK